MKIFKVPKQTEKKNQGKVNTIIGIIDASGSMQEAWPHVAAFWNKYIPADNAYTITFDQNTNVCHSNILSSNIKAHGGGRTNIIKAFNEFEAKLNTFPSGSNLTVIFISDGKDNETVSFDTQIKQLKGNQKDMYVNFLCLGVGAGFPTFLSMGLREKYHTGDATIPAIFLIEYISEKAFMNKFESMKEYFSYNAKLEIFPPVIQYPWEEPKESVFENTWVVSDSSMLEVDGTVYDLSKDNTNFEGIVEICKGWLQTINLESLKANSSDTVKEMARKTLKIMMLFADQIKKERGFDLLNLNPDEEGSAELTFHQKVLKNIIKHTLSRVGWFFDELKLLSEGKSPKEVDEFTAAKKIGLGTILGKHQQKALALKGITVHEFKQFIEEFLNVHSQTKLKHNTLKEHPEPLQDLKEIFLEEDFSEALSLCNNQYNLVESFPLIGFATWLKRFHGSAVNPWLIQVQFIAVNHKMIDTTMIVKQIGLNNLRVNVDENRSEEVNVVIPLLDKEDEDMRNLLRTKMFHLLMGYNVIQNVDTLYDDAYLALLSNTLIYLLREGDFPKKKQLIEKVYLTVKLAYYDEPEFMNYREGLLKDPIVTISEDKEHIKRYGSNDIAKPLIHIFMIIMDGAANKQQEKSLMEILTAWYFFTLTKEPNFDIKSYFKCKLVSDSHMVVLDAVRKRFKEFFTIGDLKREVHTAFDKTVWNSNPQYEYSWDLKELYKPENKINLNLIEKLAQMLINTQSTKEDNILGLARAFLSTSFKQMFAGINANSSIDILTANIGKDLTKAKKRDVKELPSCQIAIDVLLKEFKNWFKQIHFEVVPITTKHLTEYCSKHNIRFTDYEFDEYNGLIRNACLAPNCPFYLKIHKRLGHHLCIWEDDMPPSFHSTVKKFCDLSPEEIYENFSTGRGMHMFGGLFKYQPEVFGRTKEQVIEYIIKVREVLIKEETNKE